jgi:hypothetical protein
MRKRALASFVCVLLCAATTQEASAQLYAHRTQVPVPLDDTTRHSGFFPGIDYFADIQRSPRSTADDRAWDIRLAGSAELWRFGQHTSVLISAADEVVANAMKDGGFNPRGISWELGLAVVRRFGTFDWQLGFVHICRHEVDNTDHPQIQTTPADYVPTERTMSANGPRMAFILRPVALGKRLRLRGIVGGEAYFHKWDGRQAADTTIAMAVNSWMQARGAASAALRLDAELRRRTTLFVRGSGIGVLFTDAPGLPVSGPLQGNDRLEAGLRAPGGGGAIELYWAAERLFDDMMTPAPRASRISGFGVRLVGLNHF